MRTIVFGWINDTLGSATFGKPCAAVWKLHGTVADLRKARKYADELRYRVFVYRTDDTRNILQITRERTGT